MKYAIKVNEVKKENGNVKGFATVVFGDSFKITNGRPKQAVDVFESAAYVDMLESKLDQMTSELVQMRKELKEMKENKGKIKPEMKEVAVQKNEKAR